MKCILFVDIDVIKSQKIPYKYVVHSPNRKGAAIYEFFHDGPRGGNINRCLIVPKEKCKPKGMSSSLAVIPFLLCSEVVLLTSAYMLMLTSRYPSTQWQLCIGGSRKQ
jgi:hypothetical protein